MQLSSFFKPLVQQQTRMRNTRIFIAIVIIILLFTNPLIPVDSNLHECMDWLGYLLVILCALGRSFCSIFIGGKKNSSLVTSGPFSLVRNPLYVCSFVGVVGLALLTGTVTLFTLIILAFCLYYQQMVAKEEEHLLNLFGDSYGHYMQTVPRWIPKQFKLQLPETVETSPSVVLHTMYDAALFFLVFPCFELLEQLHYLKIIPTLFSLP